MKEILGLLVLFALTILVRSQQPEIEENPYVDIYLRVLRRSLTLEEACQTAEDIIHEPDFEYEGFECDRDISALAWKKWLQLLKVAENTKDLTKLISMISINGESIKVEEENSRKLQPTGRAKNTPVSKLKVLPELKDLKHTIIRLTIRLLDQVVAVIWALLKAFYDALTWPSVICLPIAIAFSLTYKESLKVHVFTLVVVTWALKDLLGHECFDLPIAFLINNRAIILKSILSGSIYLCVIGLKYEQWLHFVDWITTMRDHIRSCVVDNSVRRSLRRAKNLTMQIIRTNSVFQSMTLYNTFKNFDYGFARTGENNFLARQCDHQKPRKFLGWVRCEILTVALMLLFNEYFPITITYTLALIFEGHVTRRHLLLDEFINLSAIFLLCWCGGYPHIAVATMMFITTFMRSALYSPHRCAICRERTRRYLEAMRISAEYGGATGFGSSESDS